MSRIGERVMRAIVREKYDESSSMRPSNNIFETLAGSLQRTCVRSNDARDIFYRIIKINRVPPLLQQKGESWRQVQVI